MICSCLLTLPILAWAQTDSLQAHLYVTRATMYGLGFASVYDTYLSPQEYKGTDFRIARETIRMTKLFDGNVSLQNFFQANVAYTHNRADNNNTFSGLVNWNYGLHYQFRITNDFKILTGGLTDINGGFVYNLRNSNNPASARAYINLAASAMLIWQVRLKNYPLTLRYQANIPVIGAMFSPHYGQSYYEIFTLGNSHRVIRLTSLHNQPSLRQMLSVDFPINSTKLRCMFMCDTQQSRLNGLETHTYGYVFMLGLVKDLYRVRNKNGDPLPPSIRAY